MQLVTDPAEVVMDPDVHPWTVRLKYTTVAELLSDYRQSNAVIGRRSCPVSDYLAAHIDDDVTEVEAFVYAHPEWGAPAICESMVKTLQFNNADASEHGEFLAAWAQHYLMLNLVKYHPFDLARGPFSLMLKHPAMRFAGPAAAYCALAYLNAGHPNPRKFLEKPEVAAKFPADLNIAAFAAPDFDPA